MSYVSLLLFAVDKFLIIWRACVFLVGETTESSPKIELYSRFGLQIVWLFLVINHWNVFLHPATNFGKFGVNFFWSTGMKLGWTEEEMMKWLPTKFCGWALNAVSDLKRSYWRSTPGKRAWTLTETLYQFDVRLSDNPIFYERSYTLFARGKAGNRTELIETSNTMDQRARQQSSHRQWLKQVEALTLL